MKMFAILRSRIPIISNSLLHQTQAAIRPCIRHNPASYTPIQFYSKKKDSGGAKKNQKNQKESASSTQPKHDISDFDMEKVKKGMLETIERLKKDLGGIRLGRANPALLDSITVSHKGSKVPLSQIGQVSAKDAQNLIVVLNDEEFTKLAEKAIKDSNLGLNPQVIEKNVLKVVIPRMSNEYRESLLKNLSQLAEKARTRVRDVRASARNDLKKLKLSTDDQKSVETMIQRETDKMVKDVETAIDSKKNEIRQG